MHPLDPLTIDEIKRVTAIVREARDDAIFVFNSICLKEPAKDLMMAYLGWDTSVPRPSDIEREAFVVLIDRPSGVVHEITVSLTRRAITKWEQVQGVQPTLHVLEMLEAEKAVLQDERVIAECKKLGITDMSTVFADTWGVGYHEIKGRRLMQALMYMRTSPDDNQYAHPLDFLPIYGKHHCRRSMRAFL